MAKCRKGLHPESAGKQCSGCKAEWESKHKKRDKVGAPRRALAAYTGHVPKGVRGRKPIALGVWHKAIIGDRACRRCGCPTSFGICEMCMERVRDAEQGSV